MAKENEGLFSPRRRRTKTHDDNPTEPGPWLIGGKARGWCPQLSSGYPAPLPEGVDGLSALGHPHGPTLMGSWATRPRTAALY